MQQFFAEPSWITESEILIEPNQLLAAKLLPLWQLSYKK